MSKDFLKTTAGILGSILLALLGYWMLSIQNKSDAHEICCAKAADTADDVDDIKSQVMALIIHQGVTDEELNAARSSVRRKRRAH